jgi:hypothetical protein
VHGFNMGYTAVQLICHAIIKNQCRRRASTTTHQTEERTMNAVIGFGLAAIVMAQSAFAGHTQEFYDMNAGSPWFAPGSPTTANSALGVSHGLTGDYLGVFGADSVSWFGLDNEAGQVSISFDLIVRGLWNSADTFNVTFSSSDAENISPVETLVAFTSSPDLFALGNAPLPPGVSFLYADGSVIEVAYHITTTVYAFGVDSFSSVGGWTLTFAGTPSSLNGKWGIDNLDIRWGASAVPEPGNALLLVAALPLIAGMAYRRRNKA